MEWFDEARSESKETNREAAEMSIENNAAELVKFYGPKDICNAYETVFYFRHFPDSIYIGKSK